MNTTKPLHGTATRNLAAGITAGEPVRVYQNLVGTYRIKAAGKRTIPALTWEQVTERVQPA